MSPAETLSPAGFLLAEGGSHARVRRSKISSRNPSRPCRHATLAVRRDVGGAVSNSRLCLRHRCKQKSVSRTKTRATSIPASPIPRSPCSSSACARSKAPRPPARPRPAWRQWQLRSWVSSGPVTTWWRQRRCSAPAATWSRSIARATASPAPSSTVPISINGARRCGRTPRPSSWKARPTRPWK